MARQTKGLLYFFISDARYSLTIFWSILLITTVLCIALSYFLIGIENARVYFSLPSVMYIYCSILGFLTVKEAIPFALKMGATRKNIFISIGLFFLGISFLKALASSTLQSIISLFNDAAGITTFKFIHLADFVSDTFLNRIIIDSIVMFLLFSIMFLFGLLFYRTGLLGGGSVVAVLVVLLIFGIAEGTLIEFVIELFSSVELTFFYQLFALSILIYGFSYLLTRKITIIKTK